MQMPLTFLGIYPLLISQDVIKQTPPLYHMTSTRQRDNQGVWTYKCGALVAGMPFAIALPHTLDVLIIKHQITICNE